MAFDEYHLALDAAGNMQASGPDGPIGGLQAVSRTAYTSVLPPRQFKSIGQAVAVQIDNPTEAGIFLPDSTLYVPPHTSGYQSDLSRPALQAFVQARIDSVVVQFPAGGELCVLRYLDVPVSFSPGTSSAGTIAAELVVPGNVTPSSTDSVGVFARRIGLTVGMGYDLAGTDNANYAPARTPNTWISSFATVPTGGLWVNVGSLVPSQNQVCYVLALQAILENSGGGAIPAGRLLWRLVVGGSQVLQGVLLRDSAGYAAVGELPLPGNGYGPTPAGATVEIDVWSDVGGVGLIGEVIAGLAVH